MGKSMLLTELFALPKADKAERKFLSKLDLMSEQLLALNENSQTQVKVIDELRKMFLTRDK